MLECRARSSARRWFSTRVVLQNGPNCTRRRDDLMAALSILSAHNRVRVVEMGRRRMIRVKPALLDGTAEVLPVSEVPEHQRRLERRGRAGAARAAGVVSRRPRKTAR